jgi:hypothetical protein
VAEGCGGGGEGPASVGEGGGGSEGALVLTVEYGLQRNAGGGVPFSSWGVLPWQHAMLVLP